MGLIRKTMSASTFGAVKFQSKREAQTKAANEQAHVLKEQSKLLKSERKAREREERERQLAGAEGKPWFKQPTIAAAAKVIAARPSETQPLTEIEASTEGEAAASISVELERLAELHDRGVLTDHEFNDAKRKILAADN